MATSPRYEDPRMKTSGKKHHKSMAYINHVLGTGMKSSRTGLIVALACRIHRHDFISFALKFVKSSMLLVDDRVHCEICTQFCKPKSIFIPIWIHWRVQCPAVQEGTPPMISFCDASLEDGQMPRLLVMGACLKSSCAFNFVAAR